MPSKPRTFLASPDGISQLNAAKARLKLTTAAIAKLAGVSADTVGRLLRGKRVGEASVEAIAAADLAITKSGTANLEISLMGIPQVVLYRVNPITAWVARHVLRFSIPFMSPPNLVLMQPIVPEFLQEQATPDNITQTALDLLLNPQRRQQMLDDYAKMRQAMGEPGVCDCAALEILGMLRKQG